LSAGALPQTPLWELTVVPHTPNWILGGLLLRGGGKGEKRRGRKRREGEGQ